MKAWLPGSQHLSPNKNKDLSSFLSTIRSNLGRLAIRIVAAGACSPDEPPRQRHPRDSDAFR